MSLELPVVWSDAHVGHDPDGEIWVGVRTPGTEVPARAEVIRAAVTAAGARLVPADRHGDDALLAVHSPELLGFLGSAWERWDAAGLPHDPGQNRVVPYVFAHRSLVGAVEPMEPAAPWAVPGAYCFDTMTLIGPGTWDAVRAAADAALTAADLVLGGARSAYACCRPPGHHVTRDAYGGSCYLNNAALAAQRLRDGRSGRVSVVDLDAHHGNGTQSIFWGRGDVLTASVHVDPAAGWFPHFLGLSAERGAGEGEGANLNLPLEPGSGDETWLEAVAALAAAVRAHRSDVLVVALGVDAAGGDPESPLEVSAVGYRQAGRLLGSLSLPTVVVQEGGYDLETIGSLVVETLTGLEEGLGRVST
jgi:acetoin utilization deacetylase AcuC-like enzyme